MASGKGILINALGGLLLREGRVSHVGNVSPRFRWVEARIDGLHDVSWTPGDKVQVLLPDRDMRTYTPVTWHRDRGTAEFLLYRNQPVDIREVDERPGARFVRTVQVGDPFRFVGPQRSLVVDPTHPVVLFGDETSFAVALALRGAATTPPACVFEVESLSESASVLGEFGMSDAVCVERAADDSHLVKVAQHLEEQLAGRQHAKLLMTGRAQAIQALQSRRRAAGQSRADKTKAYWSLGRSGLD